jgi:hypothetical protein
VVEYQVTAPWPVCIPSAAYDTNRCGETIIVSMERDTPEEIRKLLAFYDDGMMTQAEFESRVYELFFNPEEWEALENGEEMMAFGSCCCSSHPPTRTFKVEVTLQPHGYTIKRCT